YGVGFYLTSSSEQADAWVKRKLKNDSECGYINVYEYDETMEGELNTLVFDNADEVWLDFVMKNRTRRNFTHDYDIVKGPVANDRVYASFALYESGLIDKQELIRELRTYKLVNQILIHTNKALSIIKWRNAIKVSK
ncbi:MAG: DUF3990 domain-containing protein, partial [Muribaculaceae bacterium]|nr:DUF3990 domain-containing protein [Muribaculaceae bacterium]